jgi:nitroreductase|tara:strand:- start:104859 stop:105419 length:561 start_codon:yes stop_codon:yes gene_type:complete
MVRDFTNQPLLPEQARSLIKLARLAPRAGNTEGVRYSLLEDENVTAYWDITLSGNKREIFPWPGLLNAPTLIIVWVSPESYVQRYGENDKKSTGLGKGESEWTTPYWWVDGGMAAMSILLAAESQNLGSLFFGIFDHEARVKSEYGIPEEYKAIGTIALGHPAKQQRPSKSTKRDRATLDELIFDT